MSAPSDRKDGWPDRRVLDLLGIELPILQAPMAGRTARPSPSRSRRRAGSARFRARRSIPTGSERRSARSAGRPTGRSASTSSVTRRPPPTPRGRPPGAPASRPTTPSGGSTGAPSAGASRRPFDEAACELVETLRPPVVSFHFGLPEERLLRRVRDAGAAVLGSATTVAEARWLAARGCDAIVAQGAEAGGHRGQFLSRDPARQVGTLALVPQVADAVGVPVVAAGGIADARGIVAAFALGAAAVQIGTAYLRCPEATIHAVYRRALGEVADDGTALTNAFSGRPARGIVNRFVREVGPMSELAPEFPLASGAVAPLRAASEASGSPDFAQMWAGQAAPLGREAAAGDLTREWAARAREGLRKFAS